VISPAKKGKTKQKKEEGKRAVCPYSWRKKAATLYFARKQDLAHGRSKDRTGGKKRQSYMLLEKDLASMLSWGKSLREEKTAETQKREKDQRSANWGKRRLSHYQKI